MSGVCALRPWTPQPPGELLELAEEAQRRRRSTPARTLHDHGYLVFWASRYDLAQRPFEQALTLAEEQGDASLQALALAGLGRVAINTDVPEAVRLLRRAQAATQDLDDADPGRSSAPHVLGMALQGLRIVADRVDRHRCAAVPCAPGMLCRTSM
ncbi:hypothetical protein AB0H83_49815 [Dactylosporangium sp. NPDC050688]|uniref:hypothetical protein n=1 Tax=Dactylosporangium sp. NPDC050688 TaxID=3157217 RepID=UPI0033C57AD3